MPGDRFLARLRPLLDERPDALLLLFAPGRGLILRYMARALDAGERWLLWPKYNWCPTVALCWPVALAADFLEFGEEVVAKRAARGLTTHGDDPYVGAWLLDRKLEAWATVPCLVEHPDDTDSIFRPRAKGPQAGANRARVAALFHG